MEFMHSQLAAQEIGYAAQMIREAFEKTAKEMRRPFMLLKPSIYRDGEKWCCLYGKDIQSGIAGFGDTPEQASIQFDIEWLNKK